MRTHSEQHRRRFCSKAKKPYTIRKLAQTQEPKKKKVPCDPSNVTGPEFEYPKTRRTKSKEEMKMTKKKKKKWNLLIVAVFFIRNRELLTYIGKGLKFFIGPTLVKCAAATVSYS